MKPKPARLSTADYLDQDANSPLKREFVDGEVYAMAGASRQHNLLVTNLVWRAREATKSQAGCQVFAADMKVQVAARNSFYYPDVAGCCDPEDRDERFLTRPCFIIEVLSPSTASIDRREKRAAYATLKSLQDYLIVNQSRMIVEIYRRAGDTWLASVATEPEDVVEISCLDLRLSLKEIYDGVDLSLGVAEPESPEYVFV